MKLLYYYFETSKPMDQWKRVHFINELSQHGICVDTFNPLVFNSFEEANQKLLDYVKNNPVDLFVSSTLKESMLAGDVISEIRKMGIPTLCLRFDNLTTPFDDKKNGVLYDLVWLFSKETSHLYKKWGVNTMFAPFAANPYAYKYEQDGIIRKACFIGTPYGSRAKMINTISKGGGKVDLFFGKNNNAAPSEHQEIEVKLQVNTTSSYLSYYNRVRFAEGRKLLYSALLNKLSKGQELDKNSNVAISPSVPFEEMIKLYSNYALSLSFTSTENSDILKKPLGRTFLRTFEIPMAGGIQICRYFEELNDYFEDGKEIIMYKTDEELIDKVDYILNKATDSEIIRMKQSARKRSENEHTWMKRFDVAFEKLGLKVVK